MDTAIYSFGAGLVLRPSYAEMDFYKLVLGAVGLMVKSTFTLIKNMEGYRVSAPLQKVLTGYVFVK